MHLRLTDAYDADSAGGVCFLTGAAKRGDERIVDLGVNVDDLPLHGFLYASEAGLVEIAKLLGWKTGAQAEALDEEMALLERQRDEWKARAVAAEAALAAMEDLRSALTPVAP